MTRFFWQTARLEKQLCYFFCLCFYLFTISATHISKAKSFKEHKPDMELIAPPTSPSGLTVTTISSRAIELNWKDNSNNETGFRIERSLNASSGFEAFAILPSKATYLVDHGLSPATTYFYRVSAINDDGESAFTSIANTSTNSNADELPDYWSNTSTGGAFGGSAGFENGHFFISGSGFFNDNINGSHLIYQEMEGDGEIIGQIIATPKNNTSFHGLIMRETLGNGSKYAMAKFARNKRRVSFVGRTSNGEDLIDITVGDDSTEIDIPVWLKLERSGDLFTVSSSTDGVSFSESHSELITMGPNVFIGMIAFSNSDNKLSQGTWRDVAVSHGQLDAPTNLTSAISSSDEITITWMDNSSDETGFRVERAVKGDTIIFEDLAEVAANTTSFTDDGLTPGVTYSYRVRAVKDNIASFPTNEVKDEVLFIQNTILLMQRLIGDNDRTSNNNIVTVTATEDTVNNVLRYPGMIGKQIDVALGETFSSFNGSLSFKIMPNTHQQTVEFFKSENISIRQVNDKLSIDANGVETTFDVLLDSVTCNHVVLRLNEGVMSTYVNGETFDDVNVGIFDINSLTLGEYDGNLWDLYLINDQISDAAVYDLSERCTNAVEPISLPNSGLPFRICGVYSCLWTKNESDLQLEKKRAYLVAQDMTYDKNTFDAGMYLQPDLQDWVNQDRNVLATGGFEYYNLNSIFTTNQSNTSFWLHENFHGYQVPMPSNSKWLAEATADWAAWNYYEKPIRGMGISKYTLNPHISLIESLPGQRFARFYSSSILFAYITSFVSDDGFIGRVYNNPDIGHDVLGVIIDQLSEEGHDFNEMFAEFAVRTAVWDYPDTTMSNNFKASERGGINAGEADYRIVEELSEVGTYGGMRPAFKEFLPGAYAWNTYKIDSTAESTYTINLKGSENNPEGTVFRGKIAVGTEGGDYEYYDLPVGSAVALGDGDSEVEIDVAAGQELYLVVVTTCQGFEFNNNRNFEYSYAIESSKHVLPDDHIKSFVLEEETRRAIIDHENFTVDAEVVRGTDVTGLSPEVGLSDGATSTPPTGEVVDFTNAVTYEVSGADGASSKEWIVNVSVVPPRTDTDILTFELENLVPFATINDEDHSVRINRVTVVNLTEVVPIFTLSDGATSSLASGEVVNLTNPITIIVTAEDEITSQEWTISVADFRPFITSWETTEGNEDIVISLDDDQEYNFFYTWKNELGSIVEGGSFVSESGGTFGTTLPDAGTYTLEIKGDYPYFRNYPSGKLKDVLQWGDIPWRSMVLSFAGYQGETFSAEDAPDLSRVTSFFGTFRDARNFDADLSNWDVSNVSGMEETFSGAKAFNGDISTWDVSKVKSMNEMFREANSFNSDISKWDVSSLINMKRMFFSAGSFNRSLGDWDISNVSQMSEALRSTGLSGLNFDRTLIGWARQNVLEEVPFGANGLTYCDGEEARTFLVDEKKWTITDAGLSCPEGGGTDILFFELEQETDPATFDDENHTIAIEVFNDTDITQLAPSLIMSRGATSSPASGEVVNFTNPVTYTITALDGTTSQDWSVIVTISANPLADTVAFEGKYLVYPNPTRDILTVRADEVVKVSIMNIRRQIVIQEVEGDDMEFNLFGLSPGLYFLVIKTSDPASYDVQKIIKIN